MTDDRDLRELAAPLLTDPPHPPPPLDELERRVARRRQRRARTIGVCSVLAVVLVATAVLALPRDPEVVVGNSHEPVATTPPPAFEPGALQLVVAPESAPLEADRTIEIRNGGTEPYDAACPLYGLVRWDGSTWRSTATTYFDNGRTVLAPPTVIIDRTCVVQDPIPPGSKQVVDFTPGDPTWQHITDGSTPPVGADPLPTGWYELRALIDRVDDPALGRFEITGDADTVPVTTPPTTAPPTVTTTGDETGNTDSEVSVELSIDVWPGEMVPLRDHLPNEVLRVDDDTIALAWNSSCAEPAAQVDVRMTENEVVLRLRLGNVLVIDCLGEGDDWALAFDLTGIGDRRVVARADDMSREVVGAAAEPSVGGPAPSPTAPVRYGTPVSYRVVRLGTGEVSASVPYGLETSTELWCGWHVHELGGLDVLELRAGRPPEPGQVANGCTAGLEHGPEPTVFGSP